MNNTILLATVEWDTEGMTLEECNLCRDVLVVNVPAKTAETYWADHPFVLNELGEQLSEAFGFNHTGFTVTEVTENYMREPVAVLILPEPNLAATLEQRRAGGDMTLLAELAAWLHSNAGYLDGPGNHNDLHDAATLIAEFAGDCDEAEEDEQEEN